MLRRILKSKIHRCRVTGAELDYVGSITLDRDLADAAGLVDNEFVHVWNVSNGNRFETYVILDEAGSRTVCVNGAAARLVRVGDILIVAAEGLATDQDLAGGHRPRVVLIGEDNRILRVSRGERPGPIENA